MLDADDMLQPLQRAAERDELSAALTMSCNSMR
jgi:hypothetical protein